MKKTNFEMGLETKALYDALKAVGLDQTISFSKLSDALGRTVVGANSNLQSALHRLEAEGVAFANIRGEGYKRMDDIAVVNTIETTREGMRRKAKRGLKRLSCVSDFAGLPNEHKIKHNAGASMLGAIYSMMTPKSVKALEQTVALAGSSLPLAKTLEAFKV